MASPEGTERSTVSRFLVRAGLAWCALDVTIGASTAIAEALRAQSRTTIEGTLTFCVIALFPGIACLVLSWVFSPPLEGGAGNRDR